MHVYYTGNLAADCCAPTPKAIRDRAMAIRAEYWGKYEEGIVELVQRRRPVDADGNEACEYIAIPRKTKQPPKRWWL